MSELSREQVEAAERMLMRAGLPDYPQAFAEAVARELADMLAEVVRDVLFVLNHEEYVASEEAEWVVPADDLIAALARHMPSAVREGGTERSGASGGSAE